MHSSLYTQKMGTTWIPKQHLSCRVWLTRYWRGIEWHISCPHMCIQAGNSNDTFLCRICVSRPAYRMTHFLPEYVSPDWQLEWHISCPNMCLQSLLQPLMLQTKLNCFWGQGQFGKFNQTNYKSPNLVVYLFFSPLWTKVACRLEALSLSMLKKCMKLHIFICLLVCLIACWRLCLWYCVLVGLSLCLFVG